MPNLKFVPLTILELLAFNAQKIRGSRDPGHAPFRKKILGVMSGLSLGASMLNLKFVLKLLAFNAPNFTVSTTLDVSSMLYLIFFVMSVLKEFKPCALVYKT